MNATSPFHPHRDGTLIDLLVQPSASRSEIAGIHVGALRVRIAAPPVDGAANEAIIEFLSKQMKIRKSDIAITTGATGRRKRVLVRGIDPETVQQLLGVTQ
jgi:uncharacterized protein (TIGR00251 family)